MDGLEFYFVTSNNTLRKLSNKDFWLLLNDFLGLFLFLWFRITSEPSNWIVPSITTFVLFLLFSESFLFGFSFDSELFLLCFCLCFSLSFLFGYFFRSLTWTEPSHRIIPSISILVITRVLFLLRFFFLYLFLLYIFNFFLFIIFALLLILWLNFAMLLSNQFFVFFFESLHLLDWIF